MAGFLQLRPIRVALVLIRPIHRAAGVIYLSKVSLRDCTASTVTSRYT